MPGSQLEPGLHLPQQSGLAHTGVSRHDDDAKAVPGARRFELLMEHVQLGVAAHRSCLDALHSASGYAERSRLGPLDGIGLNSLGLAPHHERVERVDIEDAPHVAIGVM
jgi:hypothetical protein